MGDIGDHVPYALRQPRDGDMLTDDQVEALLARLPGMMDAGLLRGHMMAAEKVAYDAGRAEAAAAGAGGKRTDIRAVPIEAAARIGKDYGYDNVVIFARRADPPGSGEHVTTWGRDKAHCAVAALVGDHLKRAARWTERDPVAVGREIYAAARESGPDTQTTVAHSGPALTLHGTWDFAELRRIFCTLNTP